MSLNSAPAHRSYSQIKTYLHCAKQYQLSRIMKYPETPAWYLAGGSAVHEVIEHLLKDPSVDPDTLTQMWLDTWDKQVARLLEESGVPLDQWRAAGRVTKEKPNKEDGEWWMGEGHQMCARAQGWLHQAQDDGMVLFEDETGPWIERGITVAVGSPLTKMFLDAVFVMPGGELIVVDWKTGSRAPDPQQLRLYSYGMELAGRPRPSLGAYWMARTGQLTAPTTLDDPVQDAVLADLFTNVDGMIRANVFPPNVSSMCTSCGVQRACAAYGGDLAHEYDPILLGAKRGV